MSEAKRLLDAATRVIPGGVNSPVRAFRAAGRAPPFLARGHGARPGAADGPDSKGVPAALAELTLTVAFNDLDPVRDLFARRGDRIAAVIVEPVAGNMGVVPPQPGFLEGLREVTRAHGALLIFDEVITGF